eukprot:12742273-Alexandrium_andersonii.AAC.1
MVEVAGWLLEWTDVSSPRANGARFWATISSARSRMLQETDLLLLQPQQRAVWMVEFACPWILVLSSTALLRAGGARLW